MPEPLERLNLHNGKGQPVLTLYGVSVSAGYVDAEAFYLRGSLKSLRVLTNKELNLKCKPPSLKFEAGDSEGVQFIGLTLDRLEQP